jgi:hypothetical protein
MSFRNHFKFVLKFYFVLIHSAQNHDDNLTHILSDFIWMMVSTTEKPAPAHCYSSRRPNRDFRSFARYFMMKPLRVGVVSAIIVSAFIANVLVSDVPVVQATAASETTYSAKQPVVHQLPNFFRRMQTNEAETDEGTLSMHHRKATRIGELAKYFEPVVLKGRGIRSDIDTLRLVRACRRFESLMKDIGERQIAKDMKGNIEKVLAQYQQTPPHRRRTISALLEYEKSMGIHGPHGTLKDPSAAVGILWIRRSLSFQSRMYESLLQPGMDPKDATMTAYQELKPYHGWALQQFYKLSLQYASPSRKEMLVKVGGFEGTHFGEEEEQATMRDIRHLLATWQPIIGRCKQIYAALDMEDKRRV